MAAARESTATRMRHGASGSRSENGHSPTIAVDVDLVAGRDNACRVDRPHDAGKAVLDAAVARGSLSGTPAFRRTDRPRNPTN